MRTRDIRLEAKLLVETNLPALENQEVQDIPMGEGKAKMLYVGTVFNIMPSGKYYMPWACSNVDPCPKCKGKGDVPNKEADAKKHGIAVIEANENRDQAMKRWGPFYEGHWPADVVEHLKWLDAEVLRTQPMKTCSYCHGVGSREAYEDEVMAEAMNQYANKHGLWFTSGEGDPCDIFLCKSVEDEQEKGTVQ